MSAPAFSEAIEPDRSLQSAFDEEYQAFRAAYPAVRSIQ